MTPAQWFRYGGCPTCEAQPGKACTTRRWGIGDDLDAPHPARPLYASTEDISRLLDDVVTMSVREGVAVHPGDTLVLRLDPQSFHPNEFDGLAGELEAIRAHIEARLPHNARVVVVAADGQLGVVRAETETAVPPSGPSATSAVGERPSAGPNHGCVPGHAPIRETPPNPGGPSEGTIRDDNHFDTACEDRPYCMIREHHADLG